MVLLNTGTLPTFQRDDKTSIVDLTWASLNLVRGGNDWTVHDILNMSDHRLISWAVTSGKAKERPQYERRYLRGWNANKFDVQLFQEALDVSPTAANSAQEEAELPLPATPQWHGRGQTTTICPCTGGTITSPKAARNASVQIGRAHV